jgi:hypothetical protein
MTHTPGVLTVKDDFHMISDLVISFTMGLYYNDKNVAPVIDQDACYWIGVVFCQFYKKKAKKHPQIFNIQSKVFVICPTTWLSIE